MATIKSLFKHHDWTQHKNCKVQVLVTNKSVKHAWTDAETENHRDVASWMNGDAVEYPEDLAKVLFSGILRDVMSVRIYGETCVIVIHSSHFTAGMIGYLEYLVYLVTGLRGNEHKFVKVTLDCVPKKHLKDYLFKHL